jgi:hypothetical protein
MKSIIEKYRLKRILQNFWHGNRKLIGVYKAYSSYPDIPTQDMVLMQEGFDL